MEEKQECSSANAPAYNLFFVQNGCTFALPGRHWHSLEGRLCAEGLVAKYGRIAAGGTSGVQGELEQLKTASMDFCKNSYFLKQY